MFLAAFDRVISPAPSFSQVLRQLHCEGRHRTLLIWIIVILWVFVGDQVAIHGFVVFLDPFLVAFFDKVIVFAESVLVNLKMSRSFALVRAEIEVCLLQLHDVTIPYFIQMVEVSE